MPASAPESSSCSRVRCSTGRTRGGEGRSSGWVLEGPGLDAGQLPACLPPLCALLPRGRLNLSLSFLSVSRTDAAVLQSRTPALVFEHVNNTDFKVSDRRRGRRLLNPVMVYLGELFLGSAAERASHPGYQRDSRPALTPSRGGEGMVLYFRGTRCHRNGWRRCLRGAREFWAAASSSFLPCPVQGRARGHSARVRDCPQVSPLCHAAPAGCPSWACLRNRVLANLQAETLD